jgi:transposase
LAGSLGHKAIAKQYGIGRTSLRSWVARYLEHGWEGLRRKHGPVYSAEFKLAVLRRVKSQELSDTRAAAVFNLRGGSNIVARWRRLYDEGGPQALHPKPRGRPPKTMPKPKSTQASPPPADDSRSLETLRKENEALRAEVAYLKKVEALVRASRQAAPKERKPSSS